MVALLRGHAARVTSVAWVLVPQCGDGKDNFVDGYADEMELLSASQDGALRLWRRDFGGDWHAAGEIRGHSSSVTALACHTARDGALFAATASVDCTIRLWTRPAGKGGELICVAVATVPSSSVFEAVALTSLPRNSAGDGGSSVANDDPGPYGLLVAAGGVDTRVHLFTADGPPGARLVFRMALTGPTDWVRNLAFSSAGALHEHFATAGAPPPVVRLAAACKDGKARLWRVSVVDCGPCTTTATGATTSSSSNNTNKSDGSDGGEGGGGLGGGGGGSEESQLRALLAVVAGDADEDRMAALQPNRTFITRYGMAYEVAFDALLAGGHTGWLTSASWHPPVLGACGKSLEQPPCLLTASMDKTLIVWRPEAAAGSAGGGGGAWAGAWRPVARLGAAGGAVAGFFGAHITADARMIVAHGYRGSIHSWVAGGPGAVAPAPLLRVGGGGSGGDGVAEVVFDVRPCAQGHAGAVTDACWAADGSYLVSCATDCTTRAWVPVASARAGGAAAWLEAGRPQIHGFEMAAVALPRAHAHRLFSAGDEKVLRVFDASRLFLRTLRMLAAPGAAACASGGASTESDDERAEAAYLPELSLTNRAAASGEAAAGAYRADGLDAEPLAADGDAPAQPARLPVSSAAAASVADALACAAAPPLDEDIVRLSRWPERDKLFGHANEVVALAANEAGTLIASACKARAEAHASVLIWSTDTGSLLQTLQPAHKLTVVALSFASRPDGGELLASASKDRSIAVWEAPPHLPGGTAAAAPPFVLAALSPAAHKRIVWGLSWAPPGAGEPLLASGARDGAVKLWGLPAASASGGLTLALALPTAAAAVTAVAFSPAPEHVTSVGGGDGLGCEDTIRHLLAVGEESGRLTLWLVVGSGRSSSWSASSLAVLADHWQPAGAISRLAWRPRRADDATSSLLLACASHDESLRLLRVRGW